MCVMCARTSIASMLAKGPCMRTAFFQIKCLLMQTLSGDGDNLREGGEGDMWILASLSITIVPSDCSPGDIDPGP